MKIAIYGYKNKTYRKNVTNLPESLKATAAAICMWQLNILNSKSKNINYILLFKILTGYIDLNYIYHFIIHYFSFSKFVKNYKIFHN